MGGGWGESSKGHIVFNTRSVQVEICAIGKQAIWVIPGTPCLKHIFNAFK